MFIYVSTSLHVLPQELNGLLIRCKLVVMDALKNIMTYY